MRITLFTLLALVTLSTSVQAADTKAGKANTSVCEACHGTKGISTNPLWPNLAGQQLQYLIAQLKAFRSGARQNPLMSPMAANLSDQEIDNLAAYYNSLGCEK